MTKIVVLGRTGMLGHMVQKKLAEDKSLQVDGTQMTDSSAPMYFNVEEGMENLDALCKQAGGYDYFINCIGITQNKISYNDSISIVRGIKINAIFPHQLADFAEKKGSFVLHMSTDGVFAETAKNVDEEQPADCTGIYGKIKSLGEVVHKNNVINIRCSIIGPSPFEKGGLWEWFHAQQEGAVISGYTNHFWNGVTTLQYADLCHAIIQNNCFTTLRKESAVFHFVPNHGISKFELLNIFKDVFKRNIIIQPKEAETAISRNLITKYQGIQKIVTYGQTLKTVIEQLSKLN